MSFTFAEIARGQAVRPHRPSRPWLMDFEEEFMKTPGASLAGSLMYEASYLHENNERVRKALDSLGGRHAQDD